MSKKIVHFFAFVWKNSLSDLRISLPQRRLKFSCVHDSCYLASCTIRNWEGCGRKQSWSELICSDICLKQVRKIMKTLRPAWLQPRSEPGTSRTWRDGCLDVRGGRLGLWLKRSVARSARLRVAGGDGLVKQTRGTANKGSQRTRQLPIANHKQRPSPVLCTVHGTVFPVQNKSSVCSWNSHCFVDGCFLCPVMYTAPSRDWGKSHLLWRWGVWLRT